MTTDLREKDLHVLKGTSMKQQENPAYRILSRLGRSRRYAAFDIFKEILKNRIITPLSTLRRANLQSIFMVNNYSILLTELSNAW